MPLTTEWSKARAFGRKPLKPVLALRRRELGMPRKGYRKGIDDRREPVTQYARTRLPERIYALFVQDAARRGQTHSKLLRAILESHYRGTAVPRVKAVGPSYAVARELNQIAHLGNAARLVPLERLHQVLDEIELALEKL